MNLAQLKEKLSRREPISAVEASTIGFRRLLNQLSKDEWHQLFVMQNAETMSPLLQEILRIKDLLLRRIATGEVLSDKEIQGFIYENVGAPHAAKSKKIDMSSHQLTEVIFENLLSKEQKDSFNPPLQDLEKKKTKFELSRIQAELVKRSLLSLHQLLLAKRYCIEHDHIFTIALIELEYIKEQDLIEVISYLDGWDLFEIDMENHPQELIEQLPMAIATKYHCFPLEKTSSHLTIGTSLEYYKKPLVEELTFLLAVKVELAILPKAILQKAVKRYYEPSSIVEDYYETARIVDLSRDSDKDSLSNFSEEDVADEVVIESKDVREETTEIEKEVEETEESFGDIYDDLPQDFLLDSEETPQDFVYGGTKQDSQTDDLSQGGGGLEDLDKKSSTLPSEIDDDLYKRREDLDRPKPTTPSQTLVGGLSKSEAEESYTLKIGKDEKKKEVEVSKSKKKKGKKQVESRPQQQERLEPTVDQSILLDEQIPKPKVPARRPPVQIQRQSSPMKPILEKTQDKELKTERSSGATPLEERTGKRRKRKVQDKTPPELIIEQEKKEIFDDAKLFENIGEEELILFWQKIIFDCQAFGARDITIQPQLNNSINTVIQLEGTVVAQYNFPKEITDKFVDFMKTAASLDLKNKNISQDGTAVIFLNTKKLHLQTSSFTSGYGEMLALRFMQEGEDGKFWQLHIAEEAYCEKLMNEEIGEPGMLERAIAQSRLLMKAINALFGVTFVYVLHCIDSIVGAVTGYITSIHRTWKAMRSVKKKMQRRAQNDQSQKLKEDLDRVAQSLNRIFSLHLKNDSRNDKPINALHLAIEIRGHLDELKQDLNFLTSGEVKRAAKKNIKDFFVSFIPNPVDLYMLLKDLFVLGFLMKYSRFQIEGKCKRLLRDYEKMITDLETEDLLVHKDSIAKARKNLQNMLQILCNPAAFIYPAKWKKYDLLWEVKRWQNQAFMPSLELHKWLSSEVERAWNDKNISISLQQKECFETEKKDFKHRYTLGKKFFDCFL